MIRTLRPHATEAATPRTSKVWFRPAFRGVADVFLGQSEIHNIRNTFAVPRRYLQSFCDHVKGKRGPDLGFADVTAWIKASPSWGQSTISLAVRHSP
jgi:hypothetical protein